MHFLSETPKVLMPECAAGKDESRPALTQVYLDCEKSEVRVTDSYRAARFPVALDEGDTSGPIPLEALKAARKVKALTSIRCNGVVEVRMGRGEHASEPFLTMPRPAMAGQFPNLDQIWDGCNTSDGFEVGLNAKMLFDLAKAMGTDTIRLSFTCNPALRPFKVAPLDGQNDAPMGLQMPIRLKS